MFELVVILHSEGVNPAAYSGHLVAISFDREVQVDTGTHNVTETIQVQVSAAVDADAHARLILPDQGKLRGDVLVTVSAPDGRRLKDKRLSASTMPSTIRFILSPALPVTAADDTPKPSKTPARIYGVVVDKFGKANVSGLQVVLWGKSDESKKFEPVTVTVTDAKGKFVAEYPRGAFVEAYGGAGGSEIVEIKLTDEKTFPHKVILVIDGKSLPLGEDDCSCDVQTPRLVDSHTLNNSSAAYTNDLGGHCLVLNKPNRTLEEFDFYVAVRTTEPAIQGLTLADTDSDKDELLSDAVEELLEKLSNFRASAKGVLGRAQPVAEEFAVHRITGSSTEESKKGKAQAAKQVAPSKGSSAVKPSPLNGSRPFRLASNQIAALVNNRYGVSDDSISKAVTQSDYQRLKDLLHTLKRRKPGRSVLDARNPLDWDETPTFYQSATIAHGHLLHLKQEWIADGYSLGDLLYSLPLAPGQKRQIAILDWERKDEGQRSENLQASDKLTASLARDRDISEIVRGTITEHLEGESRASAAGVGLGGGLGAAIPAEGALIGISGGAAAGSGSSSSEATLDGNRNVTTSSLQRLNDKTTQSASSVRSQRASVVQTVKQGETVRAQTELLANYNHCHAMTVEYFEVLRHFLVKQSLIDVQECLFVPLMMSPFDNAKALRWKNQLIKHLKDRKLFPAFGALDRIERGFDPGSHGEKTFGDGQFRLLNGDLSMSFYTTRPADKDGVDFDADAWRGIENLLGRSGADLWETYIKDRQSKDASFVENLSEDIARELIKRLRFTAITSRGTEKELPLVAELESEFEHAKPLQIRIRQRSKARPILRNDIIAIRLESRLKDIPAWRALSQVVAPGTRIEVHSFDLRYATNDIVGTLCSAQFEHALLSISTGLRVESPLNRREMRRRHESDRELAHMLIPHLNDNLEYYHRAIWSEMDAARRFMLLDGVIAPNSGGRSVASVVENRLVGVTGNCLVLPVVKPLRLDPTYKERDDFTLFDSYATDAVLNRVAVPTRGVYAEAIMGDCNSCEKKDETRFWRFEESPLPDQPTAIQTLSTDSRKSPAPDLTPKEFAAPIINLQNAPQAPDPVGLAGLLALLGNANTFKDLTGLAGNQGNASAALQNQLGAAQQFGSNATKLASQLQFERSADKALDLIQKAKTKGLLGDDKASKLTEQVLSGFSGSGTGDEPSSLNPQAVFDLAADTGLKPKGKVSFIDGKAQQSLELTGPSGIGAVSRTPLLFLEGGDDAFDLRSFRSSVNDKTGEVKIKLGKAHAPESASVVWSLETANTTAPGSVEIQSGVDPFEVTLKARLPGLVNLIAQMVIDGSTAGLPFLRIPISVPLFVEVVELIGANSQFDDFDVFLKSFPSKDASIFEFKDEVLRELKSTSEFLLSDANVRMIWNIGSLKDKEKVPTSLQAHNVATIKNENGRLDGHTSGGGNRNFNATIEVWPNMSTRKVFVPLAAIVRTVDKSDTEKLSVLAKFVGSWIAYTLVHEIGHVACGDFVNEMIDPPGKLTTTGHSGLPGDIMVDGKVFPLTISAFSGFDVPDPGSTEFLKFVPDKGFRFIKIAAPTEVLSFVFGGPPVKEIQLEGSLDRINGRLPVTAELPQIEAFVPTDPASQP